MRSPTGSCFGPGCDAVYRAAPKARTAQYIGSRRQDGTPLASNASRKISSAALRDTSPLLYHGGAYGQPVPLDYEI